MLASSESWRATAPSWKLATAVGRLLLRQLWPSSPACKSIRGDSAQSPGRRLPEHLRRELPTFNFLPAEDLPQLRDDLSRLVLLPCHCSPPCVKTHLKSDHLNGGGSEPLSTYLERWKAPHRRSRDMATPSMYRDSRRSIPRPENSPSSTSSFPRQGLHDRCL